MKKNIKSKYNDLCCVNNEGGDGLEQCIGKCEAKCNIRNKRDCHIRKRKWLIADIANYLSRRISEFLKHETDLLSCAIQKIE